MIAVFGSFHDSPLGDLDRWSIPLRSAAYLLRTDHSPSQKEHDDSGGKDDKNEEDCDIREANAGGWRRGRGSELISLEARKLHDWWPQTVILHVCQQFSFIHHDTMWCWGTTLIKSVTYQSFLLTKMFSKQRKIQNMLTICKCTSPDVTTEVVKCSNVVFMHWREKLLVTFRSYPLVWQWAQCATMETREHQGGFWPSTCRSHYHLALRLSARWKHHRVQGYRATGYDLRTDPPRGRKPVRRSGKTTGRQER